MKYLPLIWAGLWRKKARTILTLLSITVAFVLFGVLQGVNAGFNQSAANAHLNVLISTNMGYGPLPIAALPQIESIPGVSHVSFIAQPLFGTYQQPSNRIFGFPVDVKRFLAVYNDFQIPQDQRKALLATRTGAIVGRQIAQKYGLKIGDRLPVTAPVPRKDGAADWVLDIVGIFDDSEQMRIGNGFIFNYDYYDEARSTNNGTVLQYQTIIENPAEAATIIAAIDGMFDNSAYQTRTMTAREEAQTRIESLGDIGYIVNAIVAAAFFTLLFLTGNTMTQSVRERLGEFAVLKTLGFSSGAVASFIIAEAMVLCAVGAALGLGIAAVLYPAVSANLPGIGHLAGSVVIAGAVAALIVALVSGLPPAWRVNRMQIIDALAGR